jgi:hypothetical protein
MNSIEEEKECFRSDTAAYLRFQILKGMVRMYSNETWNWRYIEEFTRSSGLFPKQRNKKVGIFTKRQFQFGFDATGPHIVLSDCSCKCICPDGEVWPDGEDCDKPECNIDDKPEYMVEDEHANDEYRTAFDSILLPPSPECWGNKAHLSFLTTDDIQKLYEYLYMVNY